jgi:copper chaperone CopZ
VEARVPVVSQDAVRRESQLPPPLKNLPIELKVPLCCENCEKKVYDKLMDLSGVENVIMDQYNQKVVVTGNVDPARVLSRVKNIKKRSVFWDQTVDYSQAYVRKQKERELAMIQAKKQQQAESAAAAKRNNDKGPNMTVILPENDKIRMPYQTAAPASGDGGKGPNVTVILPESKPSQIPNVQVILPPESDATRRMDYQSDQARVDAERYQSRLRGHSQEFYNAPSPQWEDERHQGRPPEHHRAPFNPNYNPNYL